MHNFMQPQFSEVPDQTVVIHHHSDVKESGGGLSVSAAFVFFIFSCIAVTCVNNEEVRGACGDGLRQIVLGHTIFFLFSVCFLICMFYFCVMGIKNGDGCAHCASFLIAVAMVAAFSGMGATVFNSSKAAFDNPECVKALENNSAGLHSALLAYLGYVWFGVDMVMVAVGFVAMIWILCGCRAH